MIFTIVHRVTSLYDLQYTVYTIPWRMWHVCESCVLSGCPLYSCLMSHAWTRRRFRKRCAVRFFIRTNNVFLVQNCPVPRWGERNRRSSIPGFHNIEATTWYHLSFKVIFYSNSEIWWVIYCGCRWIRIKFDWSRCWKCRLVCFETFYPSLFVVITIKCLFFLAFGKKSVKF